MAAADELQAPKIANEEIEHGGSDQEGDKEAGGTLSRNEKRIRKQLQKLGLKPIKEFTKCELRRQRQVPMCVRDPTVYLIPGKVPTYLVLGPIRFDDYREELARHTQLFKENAAKNAAVQTQSQPVAPVPAAVAGEGVAAEEEPDDAGLNDSDITLAMSQTGKSRAEVIAALRKKDGDLIEAIMHLTS